MSETDLTDEAQEPERLVINYPGPIPGFKYPIQMVFCGNCSLPLEYCEFQPNYVECKRWLEKVLPQEFEKLGTGADGEAEGDEAEKKHQKRGGKGAVKPRKAKMPEKVKVGVGQRKGKKSVTIVAGLASYDVDLSEARKVFAQRFSCGCSVTEEDEVTIQGDFVEDVIAFIKERWKEIPEEELEDIGEIKVRK